MLKFIRGKGQQPSAERQKLQRELFAFNKTVHHGFPNKPTAIAWDPELRLIAIANSAGALKVFGQPGVEFYGQHHAEGGVTRVLFLPNQGRLVSLCEDNSLHLWEINGGCLEEVKSQVFEGKLKKISAMCLEAEGELLLLGTEGGNVYFLNLHTFEMLDTIIYLDIVMQNVSPNYKIANPGAVEAITQQPGSSNHFLIGYTRGLIVLWDRANPSTKKTFVNTQQLESLCWDKSGDKFVSSHNDGSYAFWDMNVEDKPCEEPTTLYGPFPCKPVTKLIWRQSEKKELLIFAGGMPRASYSDKFTVTVNGKTHVVLDFTSKVIDFLYMENPDEEPSAGILLVLTEEELVAVDLNNEEMKMIELPYLASVHATAVMCSYHACNVSDELYQAVKEAGVKQKMDNFSEREWPLLGGVLTDPEETPSTNHELLLTGHEDGTVRFWDCSGVALTPLYKFSAAPLFANEEPASPIDDEEEWPPFKKIGTFDPCTDDPRLAIKKVWLCPTTGTLIAAGTAGYAVVLRLSDSTRVKAIPVTKVNIVSERDNFIWKGQDPLSALPSALSAEQPPGLQVTCLVQLHPPASVSAVACSPNLGLLALGTSHGLALIDYLSARSVLTKCTLNPNDISGAGDAPISRRKSFKKSLRESFRRLRKGRSTVARGRGGGGGDAPVESRPVERAIEARPSDDGLGSVVRCLHIASTFLVSLQTATPTFWAGTNSGNVYAFTINMPAPAKRLEDNVTSQLGKEIQLKHRAPVLSVNVVDSTGCPVTQNSPPLHRVLIVSEEQVKIFTLPGLKPLCKLKLTAHEGCLVRKSAFATFRTADKRNSDTCLMCLTNFGDVLILSVPDLRRQLNAAVIPPEDINGITSLIFTQLGEAFYLHSSSEFQRVSLAAAKLTKAKCRLELPESARPKQTNGIEDEDETEEDDDASEESEKETEIPLVNGSVTPGKPTQNGGDDERHDLSTITVDSVKDHILNSNHTITETTVEESKTSVVVKSIISETTVTTPPKMTLDLTPVLMSTPTAGQTNFDGTAPLAQVEDVEN